MTEHGEHRPAAGAEIDRDHESGMGREQRPPDREETNLPGRTGSEGQPTTRRGFLGRSARKVAYAAPVVLLFKPDQALAGSGGSQITQP